MPRAFVAIGSNIDPAANVRHAVHALVQRARLSGVSMVYRTAPLERPEQQPYYNCVVAMETEIAPLELKRGLLHSIEQGLGRTRSADRYAPRTIDLDLIVYDDLVLDEPALKLPDPDILKRPFLAIPLYELAPDLVLAGSGRSIAEVAAGFAQHDMEPLPGYACLLREELAEGGE